MRKSFKFILIGSSPGLMSNFTGEVAFLWEFRVILRMARDMFVYPAVSI